MRYRTALALCLLCLAWPAGLQAQASGRRADRFDGLLGFACHRQLDLSRDHACQRGLSVPSSERRGAQHRGHVGSRKGRSGGRAVQRLWSRWRHAHADASSHHLAGCKHAETRNRHRNADPLISLRRRQPPAGPRAWQGYSAAAWQLPGSGRGRAAAKTGTLKVTTTQMRPGYIHKNGVPYSENAVLTEYFTVVEDKGLTILVDTLMLDDPNTSPRLSCEARSIKSSPMPPVGNLPPAPPNKKRSRTTRSTRDTGRAFFVPLVPLVVTLFIRVAGVRHDSTQLPSFSKKSEQVLPESSYSRRTRDNRSCRRNLCARVPL